MPFGGLWGHFGVFGGSFWMIWGSFRVILGLFGLFGRGYDDTGGSSESFGGPAGSFRGHFRAFGANFVGLELLGQFEPHFHPDLGRFGVFQPPQLPVPNAGRLLGFLSTFLNHFPMLSALPPPPFPFSSSHPIIEPQNGAALSQKAPISPQNAAGRSAPPDEGGQL